MNPHFRKRELCPACGALDRIELLRAPYSERAVKDHLDAYYELVGAVEHEYLANATYVLVECTHCGLVYQEQIPGPNLLLKLYEEWLNPTKTQERYVKDHSVEYYQGFVNNIVELVRYLGKHPSELHFLDFGLGFGNWANLAKGFNCNVYGSELSGSRIEHCQSSGIPMVPWEDIPSHRFDLINANQVFEHLAEPLSTLQHLSRGLAPQGIVRISVPNGSFVELGIQEWDWAVDRFKTPPVDRLNLNCVEPLQHLNCYTRPALVKMAALSGLVPVDINPRPQSGTERLLRSMRVIVRKCLRGLKRESRPRLIGSLIVYLKKQAI